MDIVEGRAADMYFCPLWGGARPPDGSPDPNQPFSKHFLTFGPSVHDRHNVGYHMLFLLRDTWLTFDFTWSGNPGGLHPQEIEPGHLDVALISDLNWTGTDWERPALSGHNSTHYQGTWVAPAGPFIDSNVLYGDGHAVTRTTCEYYVARSGTLFLPY